MSRDHNSLHQVLEEELKCSVCLEEFVDPKCLFCGHTVCRLCLVRIAENNTFTLSSTAPFVPCPVCRSITHVSNPGGIDHLPTNYIVSSLIAAEARAGEIKQIKEAITRTKQGLQVKKEVLAEISDAVQCLGQRRHEVEADIRRAAENSVRLIRAREEELLEELNVSVARKQQMLMRQRDGALRMIDQANEAVEAIEQQVNTLSSRRLLEEKASLMSRLQNIDLNEVERVIAPNDSINFIAQNHCDIEEFTTVGHIVMTEEVHPDSNVQMCALPDYSKDFQRLRCIGTRGSGEGEFVLPWGVAIGKHGTIAVADHANNRIQLLDHNGDFLHYVASTGGEHVMLPTGIAFDLDQNLIAFDTATHMLKVFNFEGNLTREVDCTGKLGDRVEGITVDREGHMIVTDTSNDRVVVFHHSGHLCLQFGNTEKNRLVRPSCVLFHRGQFIVSDTFNHCLKFYDRYGNFLRQVGTPGKEPGQFRQPRGLAIDLAGNLLVCDSGNCRIQILDCYGNFVRSVGSVGSDPGEFGFPYAVAVSNHGDIVVSDCTNDRIQICSFPPAYSTA